MPELPKISEDFTADATGYLAAVQAMIDKTQELTDEVAELHDAIDDLPNIKNIEINVTGDAIDTIAQIKEDIAALDGKTILINVVYKRIGDAPGGLAPIQQIVDVTTVSNGGDLLDTMKQDAEELTQVGEAFDEASAAGKDFGEVTTLDAAAQRVLNNVLNDTSINAQQQAAALKNVTDAMREARIETENDAAAQKAIADSYADAARQIDANSAADRAAADQMIADDNREMASMAQVDVAINEARAELAEIDAAEREYGTTVGWLQEVQEVARQGYLDDKVAQEELRASTIQAESAFNEQRSAMNALEDQINDVTGAYERRMQTTQLGIGTDRTLASTDRLLADAEGALALRVGDASNNLGVMAEAAVRAAGDAQNTHGVLLAMAQAVHQAGDDSGTAGYQMLALATAAKKMGDNIGGVTIPLGAAAFGITGIGTAIHLVVMGTFEFLAVFVPAMYAAAAAAYVMMQGVGNVADHLNSLYTVTEALGPTFNKTAGDMLGLGHSIQTAQNLANPGVYELFGEAILGVQEATGKTTNGLSAFGQMGLTVEHILDQFGAKLDIDLAQNMGKVTEVFQNSVPDLVEFGQIFGNIGHAVLNLASDMPGLAEIVLKVIDGISQLIKWVSGLNPVFIAVVMGFEEAYRWSGLLVGVFGILGRALSLVGTLGLPVIAKIGMNFGQMAANVITGVADMVINFTSIGEKIGLFGSAVKTATNDATDAQNKSNAAAQEWSRIQIAAWQGTATEADVAAAEEAAATARVEAAQATAAAGSVESAGIMDGAMATVIGGLGRAAEFMTGPWGAAIGVAVLGLGALTIWLLNSKSAAQQFADSTQKAVQAATNLSALNTISQEMAANQQKLGQAVNTANGYIEHQQVAFNNNLMSAENAIGTLTQNQEKLFNDQTTVLSGAVSITKEYGVNFPAALGIADAAGVKLVNGYNGQSQAAQQAQIQVAALVNGYAKMDQTGGTLGNSMNAVSVQAGLQASKVSSLNTAWDQFISMSTSLTGGISQFNLDLQQMGNVAATTGSKITAFTGNTTMSVSQIAQALTKFTGQSAQTWQAFDSSVTQANSFMDSLRTAASAGVISQTQFQQAIASVVGQLIPYASKSSAALSEVQALAGEAGGPASGSMSTLKDWVDKTGVSSGNFTTLIDTLTGKLSNVSTVAKNFAGTLQGDVLNAMASASTSMSGITGLTDKYINALQQYGSQAPQTMNAQDALTDSLKKYGFTQPEITQAEGILSNAYQGNQGIVSQLGKTTGTLGDQMDELKNGHIHPLTEETIANTNKTQAMAAEMGIDLPSKMGTAGSKATSTTNGPFNDLLLMTKNIHTWTVQLEKAMSLFPRNESTTVHLGSTGGASIKSSVAGVSGGNVSVNTYGFAARGAVIPGYDPGHDSVLTMLSPGEGVLIPQAVRALGGERGINALNGSVQHFAEGGVALPNVSGAAYGALNKFDTVVSESYATILEDSFKAITTKAQSAVTGQSIQGHPSGTFEQWVAAAEAAAGVSGAAWTNGINLIAMYESGYNPNAINLTDSNAAAGDPSRGLMQMIMTTFDAYHVAGTSDNIYNPIANIAAAIRYIEARYGGIGNVPGIVSINHGGGYIGYDQGGWLMPGMNLAFNGTGQPEKITSPTGYGPGEGGQMVHAVFQIDGKKVFEAIQPAALQYASKNRGNANIGAAGFAPNR
jgi:SLT domain-containing protein